MNAPWRTKLWRSAKQSWQERLPLDPHDSDLGSWIFAKWRVGFVQSVGCKACFLAKTQTPFGMATLQSRCQLRLARFLKHASSEVHIQSVVALTGCDTCRSQLNDCVDARSAPSASDMRAVWNRRREGDASFHVIPGFGGQRKRQQCEFCIAEAVRMQQRAHLQLSVVMATHVDGKGTRLTVRYSATTADLDTQKGQLGHVQHAGAHPDSVAAYKQSIHSIMKNFCTLGFGAPPVQMDAHPPSFTTRSCSATSPRSMSCLTPMLHGP